MKKVAQDFLLEIQTEELPPLWLKYLSVEMKKGLQQGLDREKFQYGEIKAFATPRRLAVLVQSLDYEQPDRQIRKKGPSVQRAFDEKGKPTRAAIGFAESCGVSFEHLEKRETSQGVYLFVNKREKGLSIFDLMPTIVQLAIDRLPIAKPMFWGNYSISFVRPVHSVILLYGEQIIPATILGMKTSNQTVGHRFHSEGKLKIFKPVEYQNILEKAFVIVDFEQRKEKIRKDLIQIAQTIGVEVKINEDLLDEVTAIVEWPCVLLSKFNVQFLQIPQEALISFIEKHQRCFPLFDLFGRIKPFFITVSNIESRCPEVVIEGNERVMQARLHDAKFFYEKDLKISLEQRVPQLKNIIFQSKLGTLLDKIERLIPLTGWIASKIQADREQSERAAFLSKADLLTEMVGEFPELQGVMGQYYALFHKELEKVALALNEQYMPKHAGSQLPKTLEGKALAIADRIDTLIGILGINQPVTGDQDPFGLRRAAIGVIRILIESEESFSLDLFQLLEESKQLYGKRIFNLQVVEEAFQFMKERFKYFLLEKGYAVDEIQAVLVIPHNSLSEWFSRIQAVREFRKWIQADRLLTANKRVTHLLLNQPINLLYQSIDFNLLQEKEERDLVALVQKKKEETQEFLIEKNYIGLLRNLVSLADSVDLFFDKVLVMTDDEDRRHNRLVLLAQLKGLFFHVADLSLLQ